MVEIWKDIKGYEGKYQVSNLGRFKNLLTNFVYKSRDENTYNQIQMNINGEYTAKYLHRLVAKTFIPNPNNKKEVNHIDGNKSNNKVENLEWCTRKENVKHYNKVLKNNDEMKNRQVPMEDKHWNKQAEAIRRKLNLNSKSEAVRVSIERTYNELCLQPQNSEAEEAFDKFMGFPLHEIDKLIKEENNE